MAKINDILEIQDILPESVLNTHLWRFSPFILLSKFYYDTRYFWIERTSNIKNNDTSSDRSLEKCSHVPKSSDENCIDIRYAANIYNNITSDKRCVIESDQCSSMTAIPVCVDQNVEFHSTIIPLFTGNNASNTSVNISVDYSCGDDAEYQLVDDYCYKISFHETSWNDAKLECQRDHAMLFVPDKSITLQIIKSLYLRRPSYTSSGFAHVGVIYDNQNRTVIQFNLTSENISQIIPDSNAVYDLCEETFHRRFTRLISSKTLSINDRNLLKDQQIGCAYVDFFLDTEPFIRCDEIPCNRTATVICQKAPILKTDLIQVRRLVVNKICVDNVCFFLSRS